MTLPLFIILAHGLRCLRYSLYFYENFGTYFKYVPKFLGSTPSSWAVLKCSCMIHLYHYALLMHSTLCISLGIQSSCSSSKKELVFWDKQVNQTVTIHTFMEYKRTLFIKPVKRKFLYDISIWYDIWHIQSSLLIWYLYLRSPSLSFPHYHPLEL